MSRELRLSTREWEAQVRFLFANLRLYEVMVLYPAGGAPADGSAFLDSFRVLSE
ncbi:MAG: hypothetical protein ACYC8T_00780 [Myxococcaceae bacterium]